MHPESFIGQWIFRCPINKGMAQPHGIPTFPVIRVGDTERMNSM